jgi:hypothetical protein
MSEITLSGLSMKWPPRERNRTGGAGKFGSSVQKKASNARRSSSTSSRPEIATCPLRRTVDFLVERRGSEPMAIAVSRPRIAGFRQ